MQTTYGLVAFSEQQNVPRDALEYSLGTLHVCGSLRLGEKRWIE